MIITYKESVDIKNEARKYMSRSQFKKNSQYMYKKALKLGIMDDACSHMTTNKQKWSDKDVEIEALKYEFRSDFAQSSPNLYAIARRRNILNKVCYHMKLKSFVWCIEGISKEALKFSTRKGFEQGAVKAYKAAQRRGILDEVCSHMRVIGNRYKRCVYSICDSKDIYIGLTYNMDKRNHSRSHLINLRKNGEYKQLTPYMDIDLAVFLEKTFIKFFKNSCTLNCVNKSKGGQLGSKDKLL